MIIDVPRNTSQLRDLWKQAFGDTDAFLDCFFETAYSPNRCRCVYQGDTLAAMLYWFDCTWEGKKLAYLYAVATDDRFRGQGFCRALMENTHRHLASLGYYGCVLVPRTADLFAMYGKLGYRTFCYVNQFSCKAEPSPVTLRPVTAQEYMALRRDMLPENAVTQEGATIDLLASYAGLYAGDGLLLAGYTENGIFTACELLSDPAVAPGILAALGVPQGKFRTPVGQTPFAMYHALAGDPALPGYLGLALD